MPARPTIEGATVADLDAISALRRAQGWGASAEIVRAILGWECGRVFVMRASHYTADHAKNVSEYSIPHVENEPPIVTICAITAGPVGVIGSVIVRDDYQRRGLGRMIMEYALSWQQAQGVKTIYLDATLAGRPLYQALGFASLGVYSAFVQTPLAAFDHAALVARTTERHAVVAKAGSLARIGALDAKAYGGDRLGLLSKLLSNPDTRLLTVDDEAGQPVGYLAISLTSKDGSSNYTGVRIGPWVATNEHAAAALLLGALEQAERWRTRIADEPYMIVALPESNRRALDLLRAAGCQPERDDLLMRLDVAGGVPGDEQESTPRLAGDPALVYAWMASMTF